MCRYFEITYTCGHSNIFEGPCEWRDEGVIDEYGHHACTKSHSIEQDFERVCMACSGQDLSDSDRSIERKTNRDLSHGRSAIEMIIRNEAWLRKRARRMNLVRPNTTLEFPTLSPYELEVQFRVNMEFLTRRDKRRCFDQHFDGNIHYQDFLETVQAHVEAKVALMNTISQPPQGIAKQGRDENRGENVQQAEISAPRCGIEQQESGDLSLVGIQNGNNRKGTTSRSKSESEDSPRPLYPTRHWGTEVDSDDSLQQWEDLVDNFNGAVSAGGSQPDDASISPPYERSASRRAISREPIKQGTFSSTTSSNSSTASPDADGSQLNWIALDSPEGIYRLAECRKFLGISPDASPSRVFNAIVRDGVLRDSIYQGFIPRHHRPQKPSRRGKEFVIETCHCLVMNIEKDEDWHARENFVHFWNSLDWPPYPAYASGRPDEVEKPGSASRVAPNLLDVTVSATKQFISFAGAESRPPHLPQVLSPLRVSHTYSERRAPASEESYFSDSSSSSSSSSSNYSDDFSSEQNYAVALAKVGQGEKKSDETNNQETMSRGCRRNRTDESSYVPEEQDLVMADSLYGQALLSGLYQCLSFPQSRDPYKLSLFIDNNTELMSAIRFGMVPYDKSKPAETRLLLKTKLDEKCVSMRGAFFHALSVMDWDDINMGPAPLRRKPTVRPLLKTLGWDDEAQAQGLRKRITLAPSAEIHLNRMKGFREHRVKNFSPLRWSYTPPESNDREDKSQTATTESSDRRWVLYSAKPELEQAMQPNVQRYDDGDADSDSDSDSDSDLDSDEKLEAELRRRGFWRDEAPQAGLVTGRGVGVDASRRADQWSTSPFFRPVIEEPWVAWI